MQLAGPDVAAAMTPAMLFDLAGIKLNGPRAWDKRLTIDWTVSGEPEDTQYAVQLRNGVLIYTLGLALENPDLVVTSTQPALAQLVLGSSTPESLSKPDELSVAGGDLADLTDLFDLLEPFKFWFDIVTP